MTPGADARTLVAGRRFLVTGAAGFIGGRLVEGLARLGAAGVVGLDRLPLAANPFLAASAPAGVTELRHDLGGAPPGALAAALQGVDAVFHLAAVKYRQRGESLVEIVRANVLGTAILLEAAAAAGVGKVVFSSSLYAYGRTRGAPFDEDEPARPVTAYGHSKRVGEELCELAASAGGPRWTALRYLFVYGPSQAPKHGYPSVIVKSFLRMLRGERPVVYGDGAQVLDYVFVDDVVEATIRALAPAADGRLYNVGSGQGTSVLDLVTRMRALAGHAGEPERLPPDATAGTSRVARIERIRADLGWTPTTALDDGLGQTLASIRAHREWYASRETTDDPGG